jgi:hypothetical protein
MTMSAGWRLRMLYTKGTAITMPDGGALRLRRERRLTNEARSVAGRCLQTL